MKETKKSEEPAKTVQSMNDNFTKNSLHGKVPNRNSEDKAVY